MAMKPRIFISAVTKELKSARQIVANTLMALGYEPIWQDIFGTSGDDIRPMLREKIDSCSAVIQIIGDAYGGEPPSPDETFGRVSYTQYEAVYARAKGKKVYYLLAQDNSPRDAEPSTIDKPRVDGEVGQADADLRRELQRKYRDSVQATEHIYYAIESHGETELTIRRLKDELDRLRRGFRTWMVGVTVGLSLIAAGVIWLLLGLPGLKKSIKDAEERTAVAIKELASPAVLADRIRKEIYASAETKIQALSKQGGQGRNIAQIESERDLAVGRVDDLIKLIQEGLKEGADSVFERAAQLLEKEGTGEALAYLETRREATLDAARRHAVQAKSAQERAALEKQLRNKSLSSLALEAELLQSRFQWESALKLHEQIIELAPDWDTATNRLGVVLYTLGRYREAEPHLRSAVKQAESAKREAGSLNDLAQLLHSTNRLRAGEILMRRALAVDERLHGTEDEVVGRRLTNLAAILWSTNRTAEAEPLARRALAIDEVAYGGDHVRVALTLNNLAMLLKSTNNKSLAESLFRRALAIDEKKYGAMHPEVARDLTNLGTFYQETNRSLEAEPLLRRSLQIYEGVYGSDHPMVALSLNNLGWLFKAMNKPTIADPLLRRALSTREKAYGPEHFDIIPPLEGLASLLASDHPTEAALLFRQQLLILHRVEASSGRGSPQLEPVIASYRAVLSSLKISSEEIDQLLASAQTSKETLQPITLELDRRLGPARPLAEVLAEIDDNRALKASSGALPSEGNAPMFPSLSKPLLQNVDYLANAVERTFKQGAYDDTVVLGDELLRLQASHSDDPLRSFAIRIYRAAALRELGEFALAQDAVRQILRDMTETDAVPKKTIGLAHQHLALCEWRLNNIAAAKAEVEKSLQMFGADAAIAENKIEAEKLLMDLSEGKLPPPLKLENPKTSLLNARNEFRARVKLFTLPLNEKVTPLVDTILGPAKSTKEVLDTLDEQYRKEGKSEFWFIPIDKPIGPHLDKIIGPLPPREASHDGRPRVE